MLLTFLTIARKPARLTAMWRQPRAYRKHVMLSLIHPERSELLFSAEGRLLLSDTISRLLNFTQEFVMLFRRAPSHSLECPHVIFNILTDNIFPFILFLLHRKIGL